MRRSKHSVCFIAPKAYPFFNSDVKKTFGGAEVQLSHLAQQLSSEENVETHMIVADYGQACLEHIAGVKLWRSFDFRSFIVMRIVRFGYVFYRVNAEIFIHRALMHFSGLVAVYAKIMNKKFIYMVAHDRETDGGDPLYQSALTSFLAKLVFKFSDLIVVQNEYQRNNLHREYPKQQCVLIKKGIVIKGMRCSTKKAYDGIWIARAEEWKGAEDFLALCRANPARRFVMICTPATGKEQYYQRIQGEARTIKNLEFNSFLTNEKVIAKIHQAKVFCITSSQEGDWPMVVLEAAVAGLPIVALHLNYGDLIRKYGGGVFCGSRSQTLHEQFNLILNDDTLYARMARQVQAYVQDNHDIATQAHKLKDFLFKL